MSVRSWLKRWTGTSVAAGVVSPAASSDVTRPLSLELVLLRTLPGRLFVLCALLLLGLWLVKQATPLPEILDLFHKVVSLGLIGSGGWLVFLLLVRNRRRFLWRIRRKLILSYLCLGLVPATLIVAFALAGGAVLYNNVAAYLFREGFDDVVNEVHQIAETAAIEMGGDATNAGPVIERRYASLSAQYPGLSLEVVRLGRQPAANPGAVAGAWTHLPPLVDIPAWVTARGGFQGGLAMTAAPPTEAQLKTKDLMPGLLLIRAVVRTKDPSLLVIVDLPVDAAVVARIDQRTGARAGAVAVAIDPDLGLPLTGTLKGIAADGRENEADTGAAFRKSVAFLEFSDWETGHLGRASVSLLAPVGPLYQRMVVAAQLTPGLTGGRDAFLYMLIILAVVFTIVQGAFLLAGAGLARMITYSVHELFIGTERVRQGDFTHRIRVDSEDQLGDLADSFNRMSASIEHLLHVQREKQRLDDELRIAREIQKSLLPVQLPRMPGLSIADLCEPAREVGGDYYDFFMLGPRQLGVLIADVSGKGTSAALYMAELKGLMLALSHTERSPRQLLMTVNHLLAAHFDNRSFITATYAVIDLDAMTLVCARAGHTPMIIASRHKTEVVTPEGMVLGLRLPGAEQRFDSLLEEHTHQLAPGDVIVLYTDGITEAMDGDSELFGETALAQVVRAHTDLDAPGIRERVLREVRAFVGQAEPHDDMTMVLLKVEERAQQEHAA